MAAMRVALLLDGEIRFAELDAWIPPPEGKLRRPVLQEPVVPPPEV